MATLSNLQCPGLRAPQHSRVILAPQPRLARGRSFQGSSQLTRCLSHPEPKAALVAKPQHGVGRPLNHSAPLDSSNAQSGVLPAADMWWTAVLGNVSRVAALLGLAVCLALSNTPEALAARSGGRAGGAAGFSRAASSASRGGGFGGAVGGSSSWAGSSRNVGARTSVTHHHHTVSPGFSFGFGMPMFGSPFGYGGGYGAVGYGGAGYAVNPFFSAVTTTMTIVLLAMVAVVLVKVAESRRQAKETDGGAYEEGGAMPVTVSKVQVCVLGVARGLKEELDTLGATANTATTQGLHMLLQETVLALLRHPSYWVFGGGESQTLRSASAAESAFSSMTLEQRARVQQETLVNANGYKPRVTKLANDSNQIHELLVVTILVASQGRMELPRIRTADDLKVALGRLGAVTPNNVMAVELMWSPQAENDTLTQQEVMEEYPHLVPL